MFSWQTSSKLLFNGRKGVKYQLPSSLNEEVDELLGLFVPELSRERRGHYAQARHDPLSPHDFGYQQTWAKKGEYFAAGFLYEQGLCPLIWPDLAVLPSYQVGWKADLPRRRWWDVPDLHVKTCRLGYYSWMLRKQDDVGGRDPLYDAEGRDWLVLLAVEPKQLKQAVVYGLICFQEWKHLLYPPWSKTQWRELNECFYWDTITDGVSHARPKFI